MSSNPGPYNDTEGSPDQAPETGLFPAPFARPRAGLMALAARNPDAAQDGPQSSPPPKDPTTRARRSEKTEADYAARVKSMYRESERARTVDPEAPPIVSPVEVVYDLIESASGQNARRGPSSWNIYRSAMLWHLADHRHRNSAYEEAYQILLATKRPPGAKTKADANRSRKKRSIPAEDLEQIYLALDNAPQRGANWGGRVRLWLQAGLATGLRPVEWLHAEWAAADDPALEEVRVRMQASQMQRPAEIAAAADADLPQEIGDVRWLRVKNAKLKMVGSTLEIMEGRAGSIHEIPIEELPPGDFYDEARHWRYVPVDPWDVDAIDNHMECVRATVTESIRTGLSEDEAFDRYYNQARRTLTTACKRAFHGKRLYGFMR
jgi:hypothetical protein